MKFDLENLNPGTFFPFDDGTDGGVTIRFADGNIIREIEKKCTKKKAEFRRGQRFEVIEENEQKRSEMLWDYVIMDWKGVDDINGESIQCTTKNKILLMQGSPVFSAFVGRCMETLGEEIDNYKEDLEKNLSA